MPDIFQEPIGVFDPCNDPNIQTNPLTGSSNIAGEAGVFGLHCAGGDGVQGRSSDGNGVIGLSISGVGVRGQSSTQVAVRGDSDSFLGVFGRSNQNDGIQGRSAAPDHAGVSAVNETNGMGLFAMSSGGEAGHFEGDVEVNGNLNVDHDMHVNGDVFLAGGNDVAERFEVDPALQFGPGTLMVIGEHGSLMPCAAAYDKRSVGVVSGAGALKPAVTLGPSPSTVRTAAIALVGTAFCRVAADEAPIEAGDLLTSSDVPGHAMKASDPARSFGAVIGKALAPLRKGRDLIPMIIALQ